MLRLGFQENMNNSRLITIDCKSITGKETLPSSFRKKTLNLHDPSSSKEKDQFLANTSMRAQAAIPAIGFNRIMGMVSTTEGV